jgi:Protein of unknown function (DUF3108).
VFSRYLATTSPGRAATRGRRRLSTGAIGFAAALASASPAAASDIKALYDVNFAGFRIARGTLGVKVKGASYAAKVQISTSGLARIISSEESEANARGRIAAARPAPAAYDLYSRGDKITEVDMAIAGNTVQKVRAYPELSQAEDRVPVTAASKRDVLDPLSAALMPVASKADMSGKAACDRVLPIFDGWTRYDIKLAYKKTETVQTDGYAGKAVVCSARWVPVSGHRANKESTTFMRDNKDLEVWLVPAADALLMVPYKISVRTMRGTLVVQAAKLEGTAQVAEQ